MTCAEFEKFLPEMLAGKTSLEQRQHRESCSACADLVSDLNLISQEAGSLQADEEPSPRVWKSIELALRQEGLIREEGPAAGSEPALVAARWFPRWRPAWAAVALASLAFAFAVLLNQRGTGRHDAMMSVRPAVPAIAANDYSLEDQRILAEVGSRAPALRPAYEANLQRVNAYIRDAEAWAKSNPNDEEAQRDLMSAYEQRTVVYSMALDRSLQ